jgi:hypothetical protein
VRTTVSVALIAFLGATVSACAIDDNTGEVKGPIFVGEALAYGATHTRTAPEPAEWRAFCRQDFDVHWRIPQPPPSGLLLGTYWPYEIASALRRAGASYVEFPLSEQEAKESAGLLTKPGRYRITPTGAEGCAAWLDAVMAAWTKAGAKMPERARTCLRIEPIADFHARYEIGGGVEHRALGGGAFDMMIKTERVIDRATGSAAAQWVDYASLSYRAPDPKFIYMGQLRVCGPNSGRHRITLLTDHRLFSAGG